MKKVCFISMGNIYSTPYIKDYIDNFSSTIIYDVIYWDRENLDEYIDANNIFRFNLITDYNRDASKFNTSSFVKLKGYAKFSKYAKNILKSNEYDYVILLHTSAAIITRNVLLSKFRKKYIIDIRDYTLENNKIFYLIEKQLINNSLYTVISSEGYKNFLPKHEYLIAHNNHNYDIQISKRDKEIIKFDHLNISYIGAFGYREVQERLLLNLKNNPKIKLSYIGRGSRKIMEFVEENDINNVLLIDRFKPEETLGYYKDVHFINNLYGNNTPVLDFALSNKLYYAAEFKIPILVSPKTYMAEISTKFGFGVVVSDLEDKDLDKKLLNYYENLDWEKFNENCNKFLTKVKAENQLFYSTINKL